MKAADYLHIRKVIAAEGYASEIEWAQSVLPPTDAETFAGEAIWVICCSGMKEQVARLIQDRVWAALRARRPVFTGFKHKGKAAAIDDIWERRNWWFAEFLKASDKVEFCGTLPWIGTITKWHLAKNLGVDCAKPDRHLERIAAACHTTPHDLCARLAAETGDRIATVDLVLWRAANLGVIDTRNL